MRAYNVENWKVVVAENEVEAEVLQKRGWGTMKVRISGVVVEAVKIKPEDMSDVEWLLQPFDSDTDLEELDTYVYKDGAAFMFARYAFAKRNGTPVHTSAPGGFAEWEKALAGEMTRHEVIKMLDK